MRTLIITRGLPGSGKSTFVQERGWAPYTISPAALRLLRQGPELGADGGLELPSQGDDDDDADIRPAVLALLERRMQEGAFTVVDSTHIRVGSIRAYRKLVRRYRYRMYVLDFTGVPMDELKRRNAGRSLPCVPEDSLWYPNLLVRAQKLPRWVNVLKPEEWERVLWRPMALDVYRRVLHIGDVCGCYAALRKLLPEDEPRKDTFYIFHGDLVDRGPDNAAVVRFLARWAEFPNIVFLEGDHEASLRVYGGMEGRAPAEYELHTRREFEMAGLPPEDAAAIYLRTWQCCYYTFGKRKVFACHGGVPNLAGNPLYINTRQLIYGAGCDTDAERVAEAWDSSMPADCFMVHGHRNLRAMPVQTSDRVFNLKGIVELQGCLRAIEVSDTGIRTLEIPNPAPVDPEVQRFTPWLLPDKWYTEDDIPEPMPDPLPSVSGAEETTLPPDLIERMRNSFLLKESTFGGISAFASKQNFAGRNLDRDTEGCAIFVNTSTGERVVRGYDKIPPLGDSSPRFPVTAYVKENGFLGFAGYDHKTDRLVLTTRRAVSGPYVHMFRETLGRCVDLDELTWYLRRSRTTLAFEVVGRADDPHIIPYGREEVILLDEIHNTTAFSCEPYVRLLELAYFGRAPEGLRIKTRERVLRNAEELYNFLAVNNEREVEGFIFEDAEGRLFYEKTNHYAQWRWMCEEMKTWSQALPDATEIPARYPFLRWAHDYLTSHPDVLSHGIDFHALQSLYRQEIHRE